MDSLKAVLIANLAGLILVLSTAVILALNSSGSRNLALATGTLGAAVLLFVIQLLYELHRAEDRDFTTAELTVDRSKPSIPAWDYADTTTWRLPSEIAASDWLANNHRKLFDQDRERITKDLVLYSLLSYIATNEFDWQRKEVRFRGRTAGTVITFNRISKPQECAPYSVRALADLLKTAGNVFAGAPLNSIPGDVCLPPRTDVALSATELTLRNPYCRIKLELEPSGSISFMEPGTGGQVATLATGEAKYETRMIGVRVTTTFFALRAEHRDMPKYRAWATKFVKGVRLWFEGSAAEAAA